MMVVGWVIGNGKRNFRTAWRRQSLESAGALQPGLTLEVARALAHNVDNLRIATLHQHDRNNPRSAV